jgi:hypothetical protein
LFGLLGVHQDVLVEAVAGAEWRAGLQLQQFESILTAWDVVLKFQVRPRSTPLAPLNTHEVPTK